MTVQGRLADVQLVWHVDTAYQRTPFWDRLVADGWEPFAVSEGQDGWLYHLRKRVPVLDADPWTPVGPDR